MNKTDVPGYFSHNFARISYSVRFRKKVFTFYAGKLKWIHTRHAAPRKLEKLAVRIFAMRGDQPCYCVPSIYACRPQSPSFSWAKQLWEISKFYFSSWVSWNFYNVQVWFWSKWTFNILYFFLLTNRVILLRFKALCFFFDTTVFLHALHVTAAQH